MNFLKKKNALQSTIASLQIPRTLDQLIDSAYPNSTINKDRKGKIKHYVDILEPVVSKKRGIT